MKSRLITSATAMTLIVMCAAGFIDSLIDDRTGPAILFALIAVGIVGLARTKAAAHSVSLRRDLGTWLERVSPVTGETVDELNDRAVSRLRAGFVELPENDS